MNFRRLILLAGLLLPALPLPASAQVVIAQAQGIAFSANGKQILVPHREGMAIFERGTWVRWPGAKHAYIGFSVTKDALYGSGHPDPNSGLPNPLGLLRSRDGGMTWDRIGFQGQTSFPGLGAGWGSNVLYVWNPERNWSMPRVGLYYTADDGQNWKGARMTGLSGEVAAVAVHPRDARNVAVATTEGVFLSRDSGASFTNLKPGAQGFLVFFDLDGRRLWYGSFDGRARLWRVLVVDGSGEEVSLPALSGADRYGVAFLAQNPVDRSMLALAMHRRDIYLSRDTGKSWTAIARDGRAIQ